MLNQYKLLRVLQLIRWIKTKPAKSIRQLAVLLNSTDRTVYRYIELLSASGFDVRRDAQHRVYIEDQLDGVSVSFTDEEAKLLKRVLLAHDKKSPIVQSALSKLRTTDSTGQISREVVHVQLSKIAEILQEAIRKKKQVVLKKYLSVHSNSISDRRVEPVCLTENLQSLVAYEPASKSVKLFNIQRITDVQIGRRNISNENNHTTTEVDAFGFLKGDHIYPVELKLNLRAYILLREQYPLSKPYLRESGRGNVYTFKAQVYDLKPVLHFLLGFSDDVKVVGGDALRRSLKERLQRLIANAPS